MSLDLETGSSTYSDASKEPFLPSTYEHDAHHDDDPNTANNRNPPSHNSRRSPKPTLKQLLILTTTTALTTFLLTLFLLSSTRHHNKSKPGTPMPWSCGSTPVEARQRGCHYEQMLVAWVPPQCFFASLDSEYDFFGDRPWFYNENLTDPIDPSLLRAGEVELGWSRHSTHSEHCLYCWRKLNYAVAEGLGFVDAQSFDFVHSSHCAAAIKAELLNDGEAGFDLVSNNGAKRGFLPCVAL